MLSDETIPLCPDCHNKYHSKESSKCIPKLHCAAALFSQSTNLPKNVAAGENAAHGAAKYADMCLEFLDTRTLTRALLGPTEGTLSDAWHKIAEEGNDGHGKTIDESYLDMRGKMFNARGAIRQVA
jgi:hypothetical protein